MKNAWYNLSYLLQTYCHISTTTTNNNKWHQQQLSFGWQFFETCMWRNQFDRGWRKDVVNQCLEFVFRTAPDSTIIGTYDDSCINCPSRRGSEFLHPRSPVVEPRTGAYVMKSCVAGLMCCHWGFKVYFSLCKIDITHLSITYIFHELAELS